MKDLNKADMLQDEMLDDVTGGAAELRNKKGMYGQDAPIKNIYCPRCHEVKKFRIYSGGRAYCERCNLEKDV